MNLYQTKTDDSKEITMEQGENPFVCPKISIIIPCRNEQGFIGRCLRSIAAQEYPHEKIETIIVEGMSEDATISEIGAYLNKGLDIKIIRNERKTTPAAMNLGLRECRGDAVVFVGAHSVLDNAFLKNAAECLEKTGADGAGGILKPAEEEGGFIEKAIRIATNSVFGSGGKRYKTRTEEGFIQDTIAFCLYRKETFKKYGLIDEGLIRDQDEEFNYRILKNGGKLYYSPKIISYYFARASLRSLWDQYFQYGYFKPKVTRTIGIRVLWRQQVPAVFVASLLITGLYGLFYVPSLTLFACILSAYALLNLAYSLYLSVRKRQILFFVLPVIFAVIHISYGIGYLKGLFDFVYMKRDEKNDIPTNR